MLDVTIKKEIKKGLLVDIKEDGGSQFCRGYVEEILSKADSIKGIRVKLTNGKSGRIVSIPKKEEIRKDNFKFYNLFFYTPPHFAIWDTQNNQFVVIDHINKQSKSVEKTFLIFSKKEIAMQFLKGTKYSQTPYTIREMHRRKRISEQISRFSIDFIRIDGDRKVLYDTFIQWETMFLSV